MFKKPLKVSAQNQLSGKDRKTIKNKLVAQFDPPSIETALAAHDKIVCSKIAGSKMLIYIGDDYPLFVDGTGKEDFFPSIYACTLYQPLAKTLTLNEGVESYIFNGANLMWPGVRDLSGLGSFKKDQVVAIKNSKEEVIAVGAMGCSLEELKNNPDGSGIAVFILHYRGDRLWDMGSKQYPEPILKIAPPKVEEQAEEKTSVTVAEE
jgi:translation initiation factor 2D